MISSLPKTPHRGRSFQIVSCQSIIVARRDVARESVFHAQNTCNFTSDRVAAVSALRESSRHSFPPAGSIGVDDHASIAFASISMPPVQRAPLGIFLSPPDQGNRTRNPGDVGQLIRIFHLKSRDWRVPDARSMTCFLWRRPARGFAICWRMKNSPAGRQRHKTSSGTWFQASRFRLADALCRRLREVVVSWRAYNAAWLTAKNVPATPEWRADPPRRRAGGLRKRGAKNADANPN